MSLEVLSDLDWSDMKNKCCRQCDCIPSCLDEKCPCHTQPERSWEQKFSQFYNKGGALLEKDYIEFFRTEIEASYERGRGQRENFTTMRVEAYQKGYRNSLEELEGKLPIRRIKIAGVYKDRRANGFNECRTTVLNIIKSIKGE